MTLREEIIATSGVIRESADPASDLNRFRKALENHSFAHGFEEKAVDALMNGQKDTISAFIQEAKLYMKYLSGVVELINEEKRLISEKIDEVNKELNK